MVNDETATRLISPNTMIARTHTIHASHSISTEITTDVMTESKNTTFKRTRSQVRVALNGPENSNDHKKPLLDLSLFKNFAFSALCIQLFLFSLSLTSTFVFLPALAEENGVTPLEGAYLVSIMGILDGVARLTMSSVLDLKRVKPYRLIIYNAVMFAVAVVSSLMPSMKSFWQFAVVCGLYGILSGTYISQKSVVVVDILGVESLSSSFGLLLLFQGISGLVGPTVGGIYKLCTTLHL